MTEQPVTEKHADQGFRNLHKTLAPMSWKERFDHLWEYYRFTALVVGAAIVICIALAVDVVTNHKEILFTGAAINVNVSDERSTQMSEDLITLFGEEGNKKQSADLLIGTPAVMEGEPNMTQVYAEIMRVMSQITAGDLDYLLLDADGLEYFTGAQAGEDIRKLVSEEYYKTLEDRMVTGDVEDVGIAPMAISIGDTEFAKHCTRRGEGLYLMFPGNTGRNDRVEAFIRYILGD